MFKGLQSTDCSPFPFFCTPVNPDFG